MYSYDWDPETGGYVMNSTPLSFSKEPRPVYYRELDILGFDRHWNYEKQDDVPYMWAEANSYWYRGRKVAQTKGGSLYCAPELVLLEDPEPDHAPLRPVDIDEMVRRNHDFMQGFVQETIRNVYNTWQQYRDKVDVFYVAFSGGKDSIVTLDIVQNALPHDAFMVLFGDTQMEFPDTYDLVEKIEAQCKAEGISFIRAKSKLNPIAAWDTIGAPAQNMRWCCSIFKTTPQIIALRKTLHNSKFRGMAFTGIRGDESASRSEYDDVSYGAKVQGQYSFHPILRWNSAELFLYIFENKLILNKAYKKGNSRAGCLVCPMQTTKNMFFKQQAYRTSPEGFPNTEMFIRSILRTTSKVLDTEGAVQEFMNIEGWKARRSGKELSIAHEVIIEEATPQGLTITLLEQSTDWREWIKTLGIYTISDNESQIYVTYDDESYVISHEKNSKNQDVFSLRLQNQSKKSILFISAMRTVFRKVAYCKLCQVCEANCPFGFITMENGKVHIDDRCVKCRSCHEVVHGCLISNSLRLPKEEKKMGSIDKYSNLGIEYNWVVDFLKNSTKMIEEGSGLGSNKDKNLWKFLADVDMVIRGKITPFGYRIIDLVEKKEEVAAWGLIYCNWAYTSQINWWITHIDFDKEYSSDMIKMLFDSSMTKHSKDHVISAFKNIFASNPILGEALGQGICTLEPNKEKRYLISIRKAQWEDPDPRVILYSLYKFADKCDGYYDFRLSYLMDDNEVREGISPSRIFGLDRDTMQRVLEGLSINYPQLIHAAFNLDLESISLKEHRKPEEKTHEQYMERILQMIFA